MASAQAGGFAAAAPAEQPEAHEPEAVQQYLDQAPAETQHDHEAAEASAPVEQAPPVARGRSCRRGRRGRTGRAPCVQAARLLGLAQETAERQTSEAESEAATTRATAKAESEKMVGDAQAEAYRQVTEAQGKSDTLVDEATAKAEALERDSRIKADAMDREAQAKYAQVMSQLTEQRTELEKKIDDLRVYEREYRSRLRSWINDHLAQLDEGGSADSSKQQPVALGAE